MHSGRMNGILVMVMKEVWLYIYIYILDHLKSSHIHLMKCS